MCLFFEVDQSKIIWNRIKLVWEKKYQLIWENIKMSTQLFKNKEKYNNSFKKNFKVRVWNCTVIDIEN